MTAVVRALDPTRDAAAVRDLYDRAADYVLLETGLPPDAATVECFFTDHPPGADPRAAQKLGLVLPDGRLAGIADLCFGFPGPEDAYLGLMLIDRSLRGQGLGATFLDHVLALARRRRAPRLMLAVLEANPRAHSVLGAAGLSPGAYEPALVHGRAHSRPPPNGAPPRPDAG